MAKPCAYCGKKGRLTKEHVWPSGFHDRVGRGTAHFSPLSGKVHGADYIVRDVCPACNNERLSALDSYFCQLYDDYLSVPRGFDETVVFEYDGALLPRALLKIAFNSARSARSELGPFMPLRGYILNGGMQPPGFAATAELVSPTYLENNSGPLPVVTEVRPTAYRSILGQLSTPHGDAALLRTVAVNSFYFHMLLKREEATPEDFTAAAIELPNTVKGVVPLSADGGSVTLRSSPQDGVSTLLPQYLSHRDQYRAFYERQDEGS